MTEGAIEGLSRRWLWAVGLVSLAVAFVQSPGLISPDTKLDLTANPGRFLARAANLWNSDLPFGQTQNQAYGYLFPHGTFFLAGDLIGLPGWVTQRLWWAVLLAVGFWGLLRVAEALNNGRGIGTTSSRVIAAAAFALSPRVLTTIGSISSETLPMMLAPWVLLPVIIALRGPWTAWRMANPPRPAWSARNLAARAGLAVALMGAVNAVATLTGCLPALIWWACHRPNRHWLRFSAWWLLATTLAVAWWVVSLVLLGRVSPPFLDYIESSGVTTQWTSLIEMLRGHRQLDALRRTECHRGQLAGHPTRGDPGHHAGRRGRVGRARIADDARPGPTGDNAVDRRRAAGRGLFGWAGLADRHPGAGVPRRRGRPAAQCPQTRTDHPDSDRARTGPSAQSRPAARQRAAADLDPRVRPSRGRQAGGRRALWCWWPLPPAPRWPGRDGSHRRAPSPGFRTTGIRPRTG